MSFEQLAQSDEISIHNLNTEVVNPLPEVFSLDELTTADWKEVERQYNTTVMIEDLAVKYGFLKTINPGIAEKAKDEGTDGVQKVNSFVQKFNKGYSLSNPSNLWREACMVKICCPKEAAKLKIDDLKKRILNSLEEGDLSIPYLFYLKVLFPRDYENLEVKGQKLINLFTWEDAKDVLPQYEDNIENYSWLAVNIRFLFPKEFRELTIDQKIWTALRKELDSKLGWNGAIRQIWEMSILAADRIEMTDDGIRIIPKEKEGISEKTEQIPIEKRY